MTAEAAPVRPASTILLLRDGPARSAGSCVEIFMMQRHYQIEFASGALVFPGGSVDAGDNAIVERVELYRTGPATRAGLNFQIGAVRETFEESGIMLARAQGEDMLLSPQRAAEIGDQYRERLCNGKISFADILTEHNLVLALDQLVPYAHWITPEKLPKRFDTWFFLAAAPPEQVGLHDGKESTDSIWLSAQDALDGGANGRFTLPFPTTRNLIRLAQQPTSQDALTHARGMSIVTVQPVITKQGETRRLHIPKEAGYDGEVFDM